MKAEIHKSKGYATETQRLVLSGKTPYFPLLVRFSLVAVGRHLSDSDTFEAIGLNDGDQVILMISKVSLVSSSPADVWTHNPHKGGPGSESRTGGRLVSPAVGHEKKNWTPQQSGLRLIFEGS